MGDITQIAEDLWFWPGAFDIRTMRHINQEINGLLSRSTTHDCIRQVNRLGEAFDGLCSCQNLQAHAEHFVGPGAKLSRATLFSKTPDANWYVPWHQDRVFAVSEEIHSRGWKNWRRQDLCWYAEAPKTVLDATITFRIHLTTTDQENGCMTALADTAQHGIISHQDTERFEATHETVHCEAKPGDCWIMRPLTLHRSMRSKSDRPRRILHVEYSSARLPKGVEWAG